MVATQQELQLNTQLNTTNSSAERMPLLKAATYTHYVSQKFW